MKQSNKVAFVTGASSGIGKATAMTLHAKGYAVYAGARRVERMKDLKQAGLHVLHLDVSDEKSMKNAVQTIIKNEGRIDVLVNAAGYGSFGSLEDTKLAEARYQFDVNVFGLARLTQLVLPTMRKARSGKIVNISSIAGKSGQPFGSWYTASKFAVEGLSESLAYEVSPFNIDIIIVEPGLIKSEWSDIAVANLLENSGKTAYTAGAKSHAKTLRSFGKEGTQGSPPQVIADVIAKAISKRKPRLRYTAGHNARPIMFIRKLLPDQVFILLAKQAFRVR